MLITLMRKFTDSIQQQKEKEKQKQTKQTKQKTKTKTLYYRAYMSTYTVSIIRKQNSFKKVLHLLPQIIKKKNVGKKYSPSFYRKCKKQNILGPTLKC